MNWSCTHRSEFNWGEADSFNVAGSAYPRNIIFSLDLQVVGRVETEMEEVMVQAESC